MNFRKYATVANRCHNRCVCRTQIVTSQPLTADAWVVTRQIGSLFGCHPTYRHLSYLRIRSQGLFVSRGKVVMLRQKKSARICYEQNRAPQT